MTSAPIAPAASAPGEGHVPVLLAEVLAVLAPADAARGAAWPGVILDGTLGDGLCGRPIRGAAPSHRSRYTGARK